MGAEMPRSNCPGIVWASYSKKNLKAIIIFILIQRFNSVLFHETFPAEDDTDT